MASSMPSIVSLGENITSDEIKGLATYLVHRRQNRINRLTLFDLGFSKQVNSDTNAYSSSESHSQFYSSIHHLLRKNEVLQLYFELLHDSNNVIDDYFITLVPSGDGNLNVIHSSPTRNICFKSTHSLDQFMSDLEQMIQHQHIKGQDSFLLDIGRISSVRAIAASMKSCLILPEFGTQHLHTRYEDINSPHSSLAIAKSSAVGFVISLASILFENEKSAVNDTTPPKSKSITKKKFGMTTLGNISTTFGPKFLMRNIESSAYVTSIGVSAAEALYGGIKIARGKWSVVEYRRKMADSLGSAAGGLVGGIAVTAGTLALVSNPVGWAVVGAGLAGGIAGSLGGSVGGAKLDKLLWNKDKDDLEHLFWFFDLGPFKRRKDPFSQIENVESIIDNFDKKLKEQDNSKAEVKQQWRKQCMASYLTLLAKLCPEEMDEILKLSEQMAIEMKIRNLNQA